MPMAFSYIRFSNLSSQQHGASLQRQTDMVGRWVLANPDYTLSGLSFEDLGKSGFDGTHLDNAFGRLLAAVESGDIPSGSKILVEAIDRAGRLEPMEMLPLLSQIVKAGVSLVTLDDGVTYDRASLKSNHLFLLVAKVQQAYQYSDSLSRRLKDAFQRKRDKAANGDGVTRRAAMWINKDGTLRDDLAPLVTQVFEDYAAGIGERRILSRIRSQHPELEKLSPSTLKRWLRNPTAVGRWGEIENVYPPVVSKELWYRVQKKLEEVYKPRATSSQYLLSGLVKCALCGKNYCVGNQKGPLTMLCVTRHRFGKTAAGCPNSRSIPYAVLDFVRLTTAHNALSRAVQSQHLTASEKREIEIEGELTELRRESSNAAELLVKYNMEPAILAIFDRVKSQIEVLEREKVMLHAEPPPATPMTMINIERELLKSDPIKLNSLLQTVGYMITCNDREISVNEPAFYLKEESTQYAYGGIDRKKNAYKIYVRGKLNHIPIPNERHRESIAEMVARAEASIAPH